MYAYACVDGLEQNTLFFKFTPDRCRTGKASITFFCGGKERPRNATPWPLSLGIVLLLLLLLLLKLRQTPRSYDLWVGPHSIYLSIHLSIYLSIYESPY